MAESNSIWAEHALTAEGWQSGVAIRMDESGTIVGVSANQPPSGTRVGILLPAMANLHSHAFQRAMAGMTETRGPDPRDSFWSWRKLMYRFLQHLSPEDIESITAFGQMEMLESGYASVGEFHYLHHQADGNPYQQRAEMCERIISAASLTGIGLTLLPVLYEQGGCDGRPLTDGQKRFGNTIDSFSALYSDAKTNIERHLPNASIGIAPHSLRAVSQSSLSASQQLANGGPFHIHIAEQDAEVQEIQAAWQARPVEWLLSNHAVDQSWCLIHATQMLPHETEKLAQTGASVGLCPITESNLGDGMFNGTLYQENDGVWGIGTDSNVRISLSEELRTLEYSQRLRDKGRSIYADESRSTGRVLYEAALFGGTQALQRESGSIAVGKVADMMVLDASATNLVAVENDQWLDAWIFASDDRLITDVWSSGAHMVKEGRHVLRHQIDSRYRKTMSALSHLL
ncbi:MAG: formimidoylglutamate deiminase [Granulosicoccus sp.]